MIKVVNQATSRLKIIPHILVSVINIRQITNNLLTGFQLAFALLKIFTYICKLHFSHPINVFKNYKIKHEYITSNDLFIPVRCN